ATYRRLAAAVTEDLAARYGGHPALTMWHINCFHEQPATPPLHAATPAPSRNGCRTPCPGAGCGASAPPPR
ncbi:beta-galactosidase, partial [Streptomyces griseomycini]